MVRCDSCETVRLCAGTIFFSQKNLFLEAHTVVISSLFADAAAALAAPEGEWRARFASMTNGISSAEGMSEGEEKTRGAQ